MSTNSIARTILQQMGGNRLAVMTGAKAFLDLGNGVSFRFPQPAAGRPNYCKVILEPSDTYTVTFGRIRGDRVLNPQEFDQVYCSDLIELFEDTTGLYLTL